MRPNVADPGRRGMFGALLVALSIAGALWTVAATPPEGTIEGIDVLFMIDNSGSMGAVQRRLQESTPAIVAALDATGLDYRIGATTTDNGNYWCVGSGVGTADEGHLIAPASCRSRRGHFYFADTEIDAFDEACAGPDDAAPPMGIEAVPPVRMLEFTQSGDQAGIPLFSICSNIYADFFGQMLAQVVD